MRQTPWEDLILGDDIPCVKCYTRATKKHYYEVRGLVFCSYACAATWYGVRVCSLCRKRGPFVQDYAPRFSKQAKWQHFCPDCWKEWKAQQTEYVKCASCDYWNELASLCRCALCEQPICQGCGRVKSGKLLCCECYDYQQDLPGRMECWMPQIVRPPRAYTEKAAAKIWEIGNDLDLARLAADFYLLTEMKVGGSATAEKELERLVPWIARRFAAYLDMVIGGEIRHAPSEMVGDGDESDIPEPLTAWMPYGERSACWALWSKIREKHGIGALYAAAVMFKDGVWGGGYGGKSWATITKTLIAYLEDTITPTTFVDTCFGIQHCGGAVFDKRWKVDKLMDVLDHNIKSQFDELLWYASKEVRQLWETVHYESHMCNCGEMLVRGKCSRCE